MSQSNPQDQDQDRLSFFNGSVSAVWRWIHFLSSVYCNLIQCVHGGCQKQSTVALMQSDWTTERTNSSQQVQLTSSLTARGAADDLVLVFVTIKTQETAKGRRCAGYFKSCSLVHYTWTVVLNLVKVYYRQLKCTLCSSVFSDSEVWNPAIQLLKAAENLVSNVKYLSTILTFVRL